MKTIENTTTKNTARKFIALYKGEYIEVYKIGSIYYHIRSNGTVTIKDRKDLIFIC